MNRQTLISGSLAGMLIAAWAACHVYGVFFYRWTPMSIVLAPLLVAFQCWLNVGLFIVAHDCMHGSFAPHRPKVNRVVGRLCLGLYAGFWFDRLLDKHHAHHRHSGTGQDPDFYMRHPDRMLPWFGNFFRTYFGVQEAVMITGIVMSYLFHIRCGSAQHDRAMGTNRRCCRPSSCSILVPFCRTGMSRSRSPAGTTRAAASFPGWCLC